MAALRQAWGTSIGLPATKWVLEVGAIVLGTETAETRASARRVARGLLAGA